MTNEALGPLLNSQGELFREDARKMELLSGYFNPIFSCLAADFSFLNN